MAGRKSDFTLPKFDDIFSTQEMRDDEKLAKIRDIPLELIDNFPDHPYKVQDDEDMERLVESVKERGVITPAMVRQKEDGRYEIVSGHRRKRACELAGFETLRCEVVELTRDEAIILMVESNYQRTQQLPSERAFAYKMRLEAIARQGKRTDLTCATELHKSDGAKSRDAVADKSGETVRRYGIGLSLLLGCYNCPNILYGTILYFIGLLGMASAQHIYVRAFEYRKRKNAFDVIELASEIIEQSK